jgi:hypothetical protein
VLEGKKERFSQAQGCWGELAKVPGFIAQIGGWSNPNEACILALWKDEKSYENFMLFYHDPIYENIKQNGTYESITIDLCESINRICSLPEKAKFLEVSYEKDMSNVHIIGKHMKQEDKFIAFTFSNCDCEQQDTDKKFIKLENTWKVFSP